VKLSDIVKRQEAIRAELLQLEQNPAAVDDEGNVDMVDTLVEEFDKLETRRVPLAERAKKLDLIRSASTEEDATESGTPDIVIRTKRDPFEELDAVRQRLVPRADMRSRALNAIERHASRADLSHDHAERVTTLVQDDPGIGRHVLLTGSDEYAEAFRAYLEDPEGQAQRAALSLTLANGGYLLPYVLDPTLVLTNAGSANPWRRISANRTTTSNTWNGVTTAGVNAAWLAEATESADNSPTVGNIAIKPEKAAAWVFGSYEVLQDTDFGQQLPMLIGDARDRLEEAAFATGTGTGQPKGVITAATTTVAAAGVATYAIGDVYNLQAAVPAWFRNSGNMAVVMALPIINRTRQFDTAGGASFWTNLGAGQPDRVLGMPLYESSTMAGVLTTGSKIAVAGDFSQYIVVDRVGVSLMYEPMVKATANARPSGQAGWFAFWRVGADAAVPGAFRVLVTG
jgi:HK97 family phage major capsid protein